jgi:tetratricopeptide (TPR) repeat protein
MFFNQSIEFITVSLRLYPKTKSMHQLRGCLYAFQAKWSDSLKDFEAILNFDPNCYENRLSIALNYYEMGRKKQAIKEFNKFFALAPKDHRKIPHAYYTIASMYLDDERILAREYYEKGLKSENDQLPCFLPYESRIKPPMSFLDKFVSKAGKKTTNTASNTKTDVNEHIREKVALDYRRISLITEFREYVSAVREKSKIKNTVMLQTTMPPIKKQAVESIIGLKPVFFRDIDFTKDHILKSSVLTVKIIDTPLIAISTTMIVIDDNNIAERISIYNLKEDHAKIAEMFQIGSQFSIINPYIRMAQDGI